MNDESKELPARRWADAVAAEIPGTLAELLLYLPRADQRRKLEEYRLAHETTHGPTDVTRRYTSTWPARDQCWLVEHQPKRYFDGLPPFARAYLIRLMGEPAREGRLDELPEGFLREFLMQQLELERDASGRSRNSASQHELLQSA